MDIDEKPVLLEMRREKLMDRVSYGVAELYTNKENSMRGTVAEKPDEAELYPNKENSMPGTVAENSDEVEAFEGLSSSFHGKPLLRLNYLFPPEYEFFENDLEFLWGLFGGYRFPRDLLFQSLGIDHSTGIPMYKLDKTAVNHFQIICGLSKDDVGLDDKYLRIDDLGSFIPKKVQHVSVRGGIDSSVLVNLYQTKALQSLLLLRENGPCMDCLPHDLFWELHSLQVLDLSHMKISELPNSIGDATQLRYLNLSYTSVVELPNSLCNILTLETLKLRGLKLRRLPKAIRRLTSLKHLDVDVSCLLVSMPPGVGDLKHLRTLPAFVVRKQHGWLVTELKNLSDLQNLCILRLENLSTPEEAKEAALHKKFFLKKLEFHWSRLEDGLEVLENFRPTEYIQELQIIGYGGANFPSWVGDHSFRFLEAITIHNCSKCSVLPTLGRLSSLKFLRISHMDEVKAIDQQFLGRNISYSEDTVKVGAFPMLEQLSFNGMPELNEWTGVKEGDFPNLRNLNIAGCSKFKALPELYYFQSLQQLEISLCPSLESFPHGALPISLKFIVIIECPNLKERCHKDVGEDWEKLAHIPNILIDYQQISPLVTICENTPVIENKQNQLENFVPDVRSGEWSDIGGRKHMEDTHVCITDLAKNFGYPFSDGEAISFFGVFDGHGGKDAAQFVRDNLPRVIVEDAEFPLKLEKVVARSFMQTDAAFAKKCSLQSTLSSGTTALTAMIFGRSLLVANAGDCRAVLSRLGTAVEMSKDHRPCCSKERKRVESLGGYIDDGYLNGQLHVTRALGDWHIEGMKETNDQGGPLIAEPELKLITLTKEDEFLIIGSDGIWDVFTSQNAIDFTRRKLQEHNDVKQCCKEMVEEAIKRGAMDNLTVVIVCFHSELDPNVVVHRPKFRGSISAEGLRNLKNLFEG